MKKQRSLKQRLTASVLVLVMTLSTLLGTTFAWFTDSVTSTGNQIQTGSLKADLLHKVGDDWVSLKENTDHKVFDYDKWEPGFTAVETLKVANFGSLALQWRLSLYREDGSATLGANAEDLAEVIDVYVAYGENSDESYEEITANGAWLKKGTLAEAMKNPSDFIGGQLLPTGKVLENNSAVSLAVGSQVIQIALHMQENAGNAYQELSVGNLFVNLVATQWSYENDSFDNGYDKDAVFPELHISGITVDVTTENNVVTKDATVNGIGVMATIPAGVAVRNGVNKLGLSVTEKTASDANLTLNDGEALRSLDVHMDGVASTNTVPMLITVEKAMKVGLNIGNYTLYHVEGGVSHAMTAVEALAELDAHNEFYYDPATGDVTLAMATFSEVAMVAETENAWKGNFDYSWYSNAVAPIAEGEPYYMIANADQLAALGAIVGGMDGQTQDSFAGKTIKLLADINLGDKESENNPNIIFYPIGYYNSTGSYEKTSGGSVTSSVNSFEGTFDGNGNTIANFYQNTWEMFGDYNDGYSGTPNHYKDAMGLFGYVLNGTVKNLTVSNFSSDGEFTPTGVIAAYADGNSTFENIAITNCNPRVYNTGNGGIIGVAGDTSAANDDHITLKNITVDNTNKISALWGSWDVACGGLVGMYRGNVDGSGNATGDTISFKNCHVSAIIDVYNDVCANYQYYAYRYSGMIIGSVRHNTKNAEGKTIPNMTGISATGCTVNYGDWNDYYYCEFEKNSMASYSEDYQFSRVPHSELNFTDSNGNGVVDADERASVTGCTHTHTAEENHQAIYLPFHQLFTGYSWGVSSIGLKEYSGIVTNLDITEGDQEKSVEKFETKFTGDFLYRVGNKNTVSIGSLFAAKDGVTISNAGVWVTVQKLDENMNVSGKFTADTTDWTKGTIEFSGTGVVKVTIQDYNFCTPTVLYLEVVDATNITSAVGTTSGGNLVLLKDINTTTYVNYWNCTLYGNGFTYSLNGAPTAYNSKQGHGILIANNATFDNLVIVGDVYDSYGAYTHQEYYNAAIQATETTIQNSYVANCATPVRGNGVTIIDSTLYGGTVANLVLSSGTNTLKNVTTVNYNDGRNVLGLGIVVNDEASDTTKIVLEGSLKQYNYICKSDISKVPGNEAKQLFNSMFNFAYYKTDTEYVNTGIVIMSENLNTDIITGTIEGYKELDDASISLSVSGITKTVNGAVYAPAGSGAVVDNNYNYAEDKNVATTQGVYLPTFEFDLGDYYDSNDGADDTRYCYESADDKKINLLYQDGQPSFTLDLTKLVSSTKFGKNLSISVICKNSDGTVLATNSAVTLKDAGTYYFEINITDDIIYGADGKLIGETVIHTYTIDVDLSVKKASWKNAEITLESPTTKSGYNSSKYYVLDFLSAISIHDYTEDGTQKEVDLKAKYTSCEISYVNTTSYAWGGFTLTITYNDGSILTVTFGEPSGLSSPGASAGGKTISLKEDSTHGYLLQSDGKINTKVSGSWPITKCTFKGANSVTVENLNTVYIEVDKNTTLNISTGSDDSGCVTPDTLVTLADGTKKEIQYVTHEDQLLVWDFFNGEYTVAPSALIVNHGYGNQTIIELTFDDATTVKAITAHSFFDANTNKWELINPDNAYDYIGHAFVQANGDSYTTATLINVRIYEEYTESYSLVSAYHYNFITENMFSLTNSVHNMLAGLVVGEDMKYDVDILESDLAQYGSYTYADFADYITYEQYVAFNGDYLKISVEKDYITFDEILALIEKYL